jgi:hypothetical protein
MSMCYLVSAVDSAANEVEYFCGFVKHSSWLRMNSAAGD